MFKLSSNFQGKHKSKQKKEKEQWQLFHAKDFQSLMYPCFTMCRILGIFSYKIKISTFEISKPYYILSTVVTCVCGIYALIKLFDFPLIEEFDMLILPAILLQVGLLVFGNFIIIVTFILTGPRMRLLQTILKISSRLPSESYKNLSRLIHAKDIIVFLHGLILLFTFIYKYRIKDFIYQIYICMVVFHMDMLYMNCVCVLKACFKRVNNNLKDIKRATANNESHISRLNYRDQRNQFLIMELKALKKQHLAITDTVQMLNIIFSLQLLATVVLTFSTITFYLYYYVVYYLYTLSRSPSSRIENVDLVSFFLYLGYVFIKTVLVVWACETGKCQALQIGTTIHNVFNKTTDEQIKEELQLFSLQILHCDNRFSAKGLTVDAKLLATILGSITMYVIILFQFKHMSYSLSCGEKMTNNNTEV